jgi:(-)-germacrene D synthase
VDVSTVCSGAPFACVGLLVGMGDDVATNEALQWASSCTDAVKACAEVTRFMNDLASFKVWPIFMKDRRGDQRGGE